MAFGGRKTCSMRYSIASEAMRPKAQIPLSSSRHVSTQHDTFDVSSVYRALLRACSTSSTQPKCMGSTPSRRACRVVVRCDVTSQVEFGLMAGNVCAYYCYRYCGLLLNIVLEFTMYVAWWLGDNVGYIWLNTTPEQSCLSCFMSLGWRLISRMETSVLFIWRIGVSPYCAGLSIGTKINFCCASDSTISKMYAMCN